MPGRYGVSSRSAMRRGTRRARRTRGLLATLLGCSTVVGAGLFGFVDTATGPDVPDDAMLALLAERDDSDASRSDDRDPPGAKLARAVKLKVAPERPAPAPSVTPSPPAPPPDPNVKPPAKAALPADSGSGHRVVFDITAQQVWLVDDNEKVVRTYLVSGSRFDQLPAGSYEVFSTSRNAVSWHGTETMEYMVRFHRGENSNIGFHDIPVASSTGAEVQTLSQLGTPLSDGCIRQDLADAVALWEHAPVGTTVVVVRT